jgi:hypothetical protein
VSVLLAWPLILTRGKHQSRQHLRSDPDVRGQGLPRHRLQFRIWQLPATIHLRDDCTATGAKRGCNHLLVTSTVLHYLACITNLDRQCAGQEVQSCFQANITNGSDDPWNILYSQNGTVSCLNVLSSPVTTLVTTGAGSTTTIETRIGETQIVRINSSQPPARSSNTFTSTSAWPHTTLTHTWTALETSTLSTFTLDSSQTSTLSTSTSVRPVIAKAAKNLPQSCFAMAAVLATVAYT